MLIKGMTALSPATVCDISNLELTQDDAPAHIAALQSLAISKLSAHRLAGAQLAMAAELEELSNDSLSVPAKTLELLRLIIAATAFRQPNHARVA